MNPVERVIRRVDAAQQRHRVSAFIFGVIKKYGDDNGGVLAANMAHSAFVSVFPLLLILVTVLVQVASSSPSLQAQVLAAVGTQFPAIGGTFVGQITALHRSSAAGLVVGLLILVWGASGLAQAGLFTMEQVWNLPGPARPGYLPRLGRCALFLGVLAVGLVVSTLLAGLVTYGHHALGVVILAQALAVLANVGLYLASFRVLTPKGIPAGPWCPGPWPAGSRGPRCWRLGAYVVHHDLRTASVYGIFATVLVLLAWIYLVVQVTVYAAEVNVVLTRRLWPRTIVQPPLAEADRASMALQALQNQRREEQSVTGVLHRPAGGAPPSAQTPRTPEEVTPPGRASHPRRRARVETARGTGGDGQGWRIRWPHGRAAAIRWARPTTGSGPTSRCSPASPSGWNCACSAPTARRTGHPAGDGRVRLARLPARHRPRPALRLPGARSLRPGRGAPLQPGQAAARPVRQGDRGTGGLGPGGVQLPVRRPRQSATTRTRRRTCRARWW